jgi:ribosome-binding protein aMBF1 (putative translation factor)
VVAQNLVLGGREYVVLGREAYDRLIRRRSGADPISTMPEMPKPDARGLRPARETLRAILARDIVKDRVALGWSQRELARRAGIRPETLCRIESGQHTPTVATVQRIDQALRGAGGPGSKR